jgi:asparagine synthase (glutamine-hydrolysing)
MKSLLQKFVGIYKKTKRIYSRQFRIIEVVKEKNLSYLSEEDLHNLYLQVKKTNKLKGIIIEAGCALGGSAIIIAKAKMFEKRFYIFDVFGMIPPPSVNDDQDVHDRYEKISNGLSQGINNEIYYGYRENLLDEVKNNFHSCGKSINDNIFFIKGLYQDTLRINEPVSFAHIDCDWYESVMICLNQIVPNLVVGGRIIIDDYNAWLGCKKAVDEFFTNTKIIGEGKYKLINGSKLLIIKVN